MRKKRTWSAGMIVILILTAGLSFGQPLPTSYPEMFALGLSAAEKASGRTGKAAPEMMLVITNAGYVRLQGKETAPLLDGLQQVIGVSPGKGNLLVLHEAPYKPLFVFCYNAKTDKAAYLEFSVKGTAGGAENISLTKETEEEAFLVRQAQTGKVEEWGKEKKFGGNEYRLSMITRVWRTGLSQELRNALLFHDHLCPGVTSGYYLARFILKHFPLAPGESYLMIASPVWCKDDALQVILNTTAGKRSFAVIPLAEADKACLAEEAKEAAGIIIRYHRQEKKGAAAVLGFSWDKLRAELGWPATQKPSAADNLKLAQGMIERAGDFEKYVKVIKTTPLTDGSGPEEWVRPGVNPWAKAGLWKCPKNP